MVRQHQVSTDVRTTITGAAFDSFKTGLTKVIVGVTYKKFKNRGASFFQTKPYNMTITDEFCNKLYENLVNNLGGIKPSDVSVTTSMTISWNNVGRIEKISNLRMSIFKPVGELSVGDSEITKRTDSVRVDFFYSDIDAASPRVKEILDKVKEGSSGDIEIVLHNFADAEVRRVGAKMKVNKVPTVVLNGEITLENPNESALIGKINEALRPEVTLGDVKFTPLRTASESVKPSATLLPKK
jgi:hypothetical protein